MKRLERYKTDTEKRKRVQRKKQRADEQELRLVITVSLITNEAHTLYLMSTEVYFFKKNVTSKV